MMKPKADALAAPMTVRDVLLLVLKADHYPILGNEDVPVMISMEQEALQKAETAVSSPDDPPEFARWLETLRKPGLGNDERDEVIVAMEDYFDPEDRL